MTKTVPIVPAATILLLRDGAAGLEVFMVERHHRIDFATGALVFPGGKIDAGDADAALSARLDGGESQDAQQRAMRIGAIRETFEESGVLLARERGGETIGAARLAEIESAWREALCKGECSMSELAVREDLRLAGDLLTPFARWITPAFMPKRFDTVFFLAEAPADHLALHDGGESVDSLWTTPADALRAAERGERTIIFPTLLNIKKLGRSSSIREAFEAARAQPIVTVLPEIVLKGGKQWLTIPKQAGYDPSEAPLETLTG